MLEEAFQVSAKNRTDWRRPRKGPQGGDTKPEKSELLAAEIAENVKKGWEKV